MNEAIIDHAAALQRQVDRLELRVAALGLMVFASLFILYYRTSTRP